MELARGFLQATIVVIWAVYAVVQIVTNAGGGSPEPAGGAGLLVGFLDTLPADALVTSTAAMAVALVGLEVAFVAIRRYAAP